MYITYNATVVYNTTISKSKHDMKFLITSAAYQKLRDEIKHLTDHERPNIIKAIATAREHGDLSENAEYHTAKEKQGFIEYRISDLTDKLNRATVVDPTNLSGDVVQFGATVTLLNLNTEETTQYTIVGEYEIATFGGTAKKFISASSPIGKALIGQSRGDEIKISTPRDTKEYKILDVQYVHLDL